MFFTCREVDGENLYMEYSSTSMVLGVGKIILKITSRKFLTLNNVLHIADIKKNLVFSLLMSKNGFRMVVER
jgi:hypothetical protein